MVSKKKNIWIISFIGVVILSASALLCLVNATPYECSSDTHQRMPIEKIAMSVLLNKDISFTDSELEGLLVYALPQYIQQYSLSSDLSGEKFRFRSIVQYKKKNIFLQADVLPELLDNNITLKLSNAHIGRLPVPAEFILRKTKNINANDSSIIIPNTWCCDIHGISTKVHIKKLQKISKDDTKIKFSADFSL